jgi:transposase
MTSLELAGWEVLIADTQRVKGSAPLACKTDRIDARVLPRAVAPGLGPRDLAAHPSGAGRAGTGSLRVAPGAPAGGVEEPGACHPAGIRAALPDFGPVRRRRSSAGGPAGGCLKPWAGSMTASRQLLDELDERVDACERELRRLGADHADVALLMTAPGIAWVLGSTIAAEIGDITRLASPKKLCGDTGLCPRVYQSGRRDLGGPLAKNGPKDLRWALIEAATHATRHPCYREHYEHTKARLGRQRGPKVARVEVARKLAEAIWHMLTKQAPFAPARPHVAALAA